MASHGATTGQTRGDESKKLCRIGALENETDLVPPRVFRLAGQAFRPLTWIEIAKRVARRHDEAVVKQALYAIGRHIFFRVKFDPAN
jgi:hypothetical protein